MCVDTMMNVGRHAWHYVIREIHGSGQGFLSHLEKLLAVSNKKLVWIALKALLS